MPARRSLRLLNVSEIAEVCGLAPATVSSKLNGAGIAPAEVVGKTKLFDAPQALRLLIAGDDLDPKKEKARLDSARADLAELDLATKRGELIPRADHEESVIALCSGVALRIGSIPSKAAPEVRIAPSDLEAEDVLRGFIDEALSELADAGEELRRRALARRSDGSERDSSRGASAPAEADRRRVGRRRKGAVAGVSGGAGALEDEPG